MPFAFSIRGAKDAPNNKDFILPLIFTRRLCDVFDDELNRIAAEVGSRRKAFQLPRHDHKRVRFCLTIAGCNTIDRTSSYTAAPVIASGSPGNGKLLP